jgi:Ca2+:H+ antiporter
MKRLVRFIKEDPLSLLLLALPITLVGPSLGWSSAAIFALACIGIIPLASYIGKATEDLGTHTGPQWGALLNATLGNAAELIIPSRHRRSAGAGAASITVRSSATIVGAGAVHAGRRGRTACRSSKTNATRNAIRHAVVTALVIPSVSAFQWAFCRKP